jgi:Translation initiation factor eIF3 subunit
MADNWDDGDDDDDWDVDDAQLDLKLGKTTANNNAASAAIPTFDDEEDLAVTEKALLEKTSHIELAKKGHALAEKKALERAQQLEAELAKKAMELEAAAEENMTPEERRVRERQRVEEADHALTNDLFGGTVESVATIAATSTTTTTTTTATSSGAAAPPPLKDMKDHLKYARTVATALAKHGQIHWTTAFYKEALSQSTAVLDEDAISELIKMLNVMKNDKVAAQKRKVKGQAQKSKKVDKSAETKARQIQVETFGDNDMYDKYDTIGEKYEDDFF